MNKNFYVYVHCRKTDGLVFYVGKGSGKRDTCFSSRNTYWKNVKNKHGIIVKRVFENLTEEESFRLEKELISELSSFGVQLVNMTLGGEGSSGRRLTEKHKVKLSQSRRKYISENKELVLKQILSANKIKSEKGISDESRKRMSEAQIGKKQKKETVTKRVSKLLENPPNQDTQKYLFLNIGSGDWFFGTRVEFCREYGIRTKQIRNLFSDYKTALSAKNWSVIKDKITLYIFLNLINK